MEDHENAGGHTIEQHIGKSDNWLRKRLRENPTLQAVSTFSNMADSNRTQGAFVNQFGDQINEWLRTSNVNDRLSRTFEMNSPIGRVLEQGEYHPVNTNWATVVIVRDNSAHGWYYLTSYPTLP